MLTSSFYNKAQSLAVKKNILHNIIEEGIYKFVSTIMAVLLYESHFNYWHSTLKFNK
jgi:hypothetical protein